MAWLTYLQLFTAYWSSAALTLWPGSLGYRQLALIVGALSGVAIGLRLLVRRRRLRGATFAFLCLYLTAILLYLATPLRLGARANARYRGFGLALAGQVAPASLCASLIAHDAKIQRRIKRRAPCVALIFSALAVWAVLRPTAMTTGGFTDNASGLNYQADAYLAAYAAMLAEYALLTRRMRFRGRWMRRGLLPRLAMVAALLADFAALLIAGGRGGFVTFVALSLYLAHVKIRMRPMTKRRLLNGLLLGGIIALTAAGCAWAVMRSGIETSGLPRILELLSGGVRDDGRAELRRAALRAFADRPCLGHGLGGVFLTLGQYAHNLFLDAMVETGIVGTLALTLMLLRALRRGLRLARRDASESLWVCFLLCGLSMSMFSGYYLSHVPLYWGMAFILSKKRT